MVLLCVDCKETSSEEAELYRRNKAYTSPYNQSPHYKSTTGKFTKHKPKRNTNDFHAMILNGMHASIKEFEEEDDVPSSQIE